MFLNIYILDTCTSRYSINGGQTWSGGHTYNSGSHEVRYTNERINIPSSGDNINDLRIRFKSNGGLCQVDNVRLYGDRIPTPPPTDKPTINPSITPTIYPTIQPSISPTTTPTDITNIPTINPTDMPTTSPTEAPTELPSLFPSLTPTALPTTLPTLYPSTSPTNITNNPTLHPTLYPSKIPTSHPSPNLTVIQNQGTLSPTIQPIQLDLNSPPNSRKQPRNMIITILSITLFSIISIFMLILGIVRYNNKKVIKPIKLENTLHMEQTKYDETVAVSTALKEINQYKQTGGNIDSYINKKRDHASHIRMESYSNVNIIDDMPICINEAHNEIDIFTKTGGNINDIIDVETPNGCEIVNTNENPCNEGQIE